jgi:hypothetical protein
MVKAPADPPPVRLWELAALSVLLATYLVTMAVIGDQGTFLVNLIGPGVFGVILLLGAIPTAMRDANMIWTPLFWFRISGAVYFSFGNMVTYFLNPTSKRLIENFFSAYTDLITKLNAVTTLGVLLTLLAAFVTHRLRRGAAAKSAASEPTPAEGPASGARASPFRSARSLVTVGTAFLLIGGFVKLVFVIPGDLGMSRIALPGAIGALSLLADAGIYLIAVWAWNFRPGMVFLPVALTLIEVGFGLLEFDKTEVIASIMVLAMAWLSKGVTLRRMAVTAGIVVITFALIVPFVTASRTELFRRYLGTNVAGGGLAERIEIASYYFQPSGHIDNDQQMGLMRFSYVNGGSLALSLYDNGQPGNTLATLPAIFVPRALWPDKPDMTVIGREFNYIADGNADSASSPGWLAEAYWDLGWMGLPVVMIPLGIILQCWSAFSLGILRREQWLYFPFCLLGMKMGTSIDGFIVPDVMGTVVLAVVAYFVMRLALETNDKINATAGRASSVRI